VSARTGTGLRAVRVAVLGLLVGSCFDPPPPPRWIELARGFEARPIQPLIEAWQREAGLDLPATRGEPNSLVLEVPVPPAVWTRASPQASGRTTWTTALPHGAFEHGLPSFLQLRTGSTRFLRLPAGTAPRAGTFQLRGERLELELPPETEPPEDLLLTTRLESGRLPEDGVWQVRLGSEFGAGIPVWSGSAEEVVCEIPAESRLAFRLRYLATNPGTVTLRVRLDGEQLLEVRGDAESLQREARTVELTLPRRGLAAARLAFEVDGPPGQALLLHPIVGPARFGARGARPWAEARPDVVVLLADTFRADNLAPWGGAPELAPALNRLAESSVRFLSARSTSSWTLPSISSLLTGLAPGQHTANSSAQALPGDLTTIAEALAAAGYRTCAVTDAAYFTPNHGLEQGFETFVMNNSSTWDLDWTVARAREMLARDDGRPLFLLVHSYRVHLPYRVGPDEELAPWNELLASGCAMLKTRGKIPREEWQAQLERCRGRYRELYEDGVRDLDRGFGEILAELEREDFGAHGYRLFTSDHGEALGENHDIFHDGDLWETKLRIPLTLAGPGLEPRDVQAAVSLVDVTPTLAALAGLARDPRWSGASLVGAQAERPSCAFLLKNRPQITVVDRGRKVVAASAEALARGEVEAAYDLARDPGEEHSVEDQTWPAELARRNAPLVEALLVPASRGSEARLSAGQRKELDDLGYGGDEEED